MSTTRRQNRSALHAQSCSNRRRLWTRDEEPIAPEYGTLRTRDASALAILAVCLLCIGCNPFAPEIDLGSDNGGQLLSDQTTVDGVFQNFRYAYTFKDTTIYGALLAQDFIFSYRDYDKLVDLNWGRDEDMRITSRLFENAQNLSLVWNNIVGLSGDSLRVNVSRTFNLTVTFNPSDIIRVDGRVSLDLRRSTSAQPWKITLWKDESNF